MKRDHYPNLQTRTQLIIVAVLAVFLLGYLSFEHRGRGVDYYASQGAKVPCDVPSRELVFARALNRACAKLQPGHEASCMAKLIEEAVDESNKSCK